ncbi:MAG TPA: class I adenylate-forming enzyme family protein, partial [Polyangiaceae bacterium]|nr:class I adenylate-forming enzyme family protein [Polyangiaceae bacterium]
MLHAIPQLQDYLIHSAARLGDKIALVCDKKRYTYAELDAQSNALAHTLVQQGVTRGDRVVVFADNSVETVIAFWAVLKANAVVSVVNPLTKTDKLRYLLEDCRATALIADGLLSRVLAPVVADNKHLKVLIMTGKPLSPTPENLQV